MAKPLTPSSQHTILHQDAVEQVIDQRLGLSETAPAPTVADPAAPGAAYDQAQATAQHDALVTLLDAARNAGLIA